MRGRDTAKRLTIEGLFLPHKRCNGNIMQRENVLLCTCPAYTCFALLALLDVVMRAANSV